MNTRNTGKAFGICTALLMGLTGCLSGISSTTMGESTVQIAVPTANLPDQSNQERPAICDPFGHEQSSANESGLLAELFYAGNACTTENAAQCVHYDKVSDYFAHTIPLDADLIFNQLNVPTRPYDGGISLADQTPILSPAGDTLYEWIALRFDARIQLGPDDLAGKYQFALLGDDGAVLSLDTGEGRQTLIDNDGLHPSTLKCAAKTVRLEAGASIPMHLEYFQGPRYHIALILAWRRISDSVNELATPSALNDGACNQSGNGTFFDSNHNPPAPMPTWNNFLARGWKVLAPGNYALPETRFTNPCPRGDGSCFADTYSRPANNAFALSEGNINPASIKVLVDNRIATFTYDPVLNRIVIQGFGSANQVKIGYCKYAPGAGPTPSPSPSPTPVFTPPPAS